MRNFSRSAKVGTLLMSRMPAKKPSLTGVTNARTGASQSTTPARYFGFFMLMVRQTVKVATGLPASSLRCCRTNVIASGSHCRFWIALPTMTAR
jgi:hypothetical protein